jgi:DNA-directed RNA polymerase subunit D
MMSIDFLDKDKVSGRVRFILKEASPAFANSLRRLMIERVPTMAIDTVEFYKNSSALYDEILAHRLGLIPLKTDLKSYVLPKKCKCNGAVCAQCSLKLSLKAKGPVTVYSGDIKSQDPKVKPVFSDMSIVKLLKGQELEFEAVAVLGQGRDHVKFSPGLVWYNYKPKLVINASSKLDDFREKYPSQIFKDGKIDKDAIDKLNLYDAVEGVNDDIIKVEYDSGSFLFFVEPWGQLTPKEMFSAALDEFQSLLTELGEKLGV